MSFWPATCSALCYRPKRSAVANTNLVENSVTQALSLKKRSGCWVKQPHKEEQKQLGFHSIFFQNFDEIVSTQYTQLAPKLQIGLKTENLNNFTGVIPSRCRRAVWAIVSLTGLNNLLPFPHGSKNYQKRLPSGIQGRTQGLILVQLCPLQDLGTGSNPEQVWKQYQLNWQ